MLFHRAAAAFLLVALAPLLALLVLLVRMSDGGPALYRHYRVGRDGRLFPCLKFRSMHVDSERLLQELLQRDPQARADWLRDRKLANDPRITRIGRFLRKSSLDELPQLLNVLRGQMALVGPRPVTPVELRRYGNVGWHYLSVCPGMTGLWQVSGRNLTTYGERVELDRSYVENRSFSSDLKILARTVVVVLTGHGAR